MRVLVCIKQVFDPAELKVDPNTRTLVTEGVSRKISDFDKNAIEEAVKMKEKYKAETIVITMGPSDAMRALREALAMGIDNAYLLSDPAFENSDTLATAKVLAAAIRKIGNIDIVLTAEASMDGYSGMVGPRLATLLNLPQLTYVRNIVSVEDGKMVVERDLEEGYEVVESKLPVLITVTKEINEPRFATLPKIMAASKKKIETWGASDLGLGKEEVGSTGSAIQVMKAEAPVMGRKNVVFEGEIPQVVEELMKALSKEGIIKV